MKSDINAERNHTEMFINTAPNHLHTILIFLGSRGRKQEHSQDTFDQDVGSPGTWIKELKVELRSGKVALLVV